LLFKFGHFLSPSCDSSSSPIQAAISTDADSVAPFDPINPDNLSVTVIDADFLCINFTEYGLPAMGATVVPDYLYIWAM
jgi:hypothetical protein